LRVAVLTGGQDPPYARGLLRELVARGVDVVCVGNDELADCRFVGSGHLEFHNLVGGQEPTNMIGKIWRVLSYYGRMIVFAAQTDAKLFHILWFRKFPVFERTLLNAYFKLLGKKLIFTAHNVNDHARDGRRESIVNWVSLKFLYGIVDHVFVHTARMQRELVESFTVSKDKVTVVPFGINDVIPQSTLTRAEAKRRLGFGPDDRVLLFFGHIAPYKGVEDLIKALGKLGKDDNRLRLIVSGPVRDKSCEPYWETVQKLIKDQRVTESVRKEVRYIPDAEVGHFFKAADVSILPYRRIYQSGVLALSYAQGVPVIAADVGSLAEDVVEGETGYVFRSGDVSSLVDSIRAYFSSALFKDVEMNREKIRRYGAERFSWATNADRTCAVYARMLTNSGRDVSVDGGLAANESR
jgi:D-inositol-3-phosphate glycosyltransferase